jgi:hypothetical protein
MAPSEILTCGVKKIKEFCINLLKPFFVTDVQNKYKLECSWKAFSAKSYIFEQGQSLPECSSAT